MNILKKIFGLREPQKNLKPDNSSLDAGEAISGMHIASYSGSMEMIVPFLKNGGDVNLPNEDLSTLLHSALEGWQHSMAEFLILSGANINFQNKFGETPLHSLVRHREPPFDNGLFLKTLNPADARTECFKLLRSHEADISIQDDQGNNPFHLAALTGDVFALKEIALLWAKDMIDLKNGKGATALALAIHKEHIDTIELLIRLGSNINIPLSKGVTPFTLLYLSENKSSREIAGKLWKEGKVDPDSYKTDDDT